MNVIHNRPFGYLAFDVTGHHFIKDTSKASYDFFLVHPRERFDGIRCKFHRMFVTNTSDLFHTIMTTNNDSFHVVASLQMMVI